MNRRDFIGASVAAVAGASAFSVAEAQPSESPEGKFKFHTTILDAINRQLSLYGPSGDVYIIALANPEHGWKRIA